jgi:hypothetical protein
VFQEKCSRDQKQFQENYINNWAMILMTYKEFTQFGTQTSGAVKEVGYGNMIGNFCKSFVEEVFAISREISEGELVNKIVGIFVKQIEAVLQVPFLKDLVIFLITKLISTIITMIYDFILEKAQQSAEIIAKGFGSLYNQLSAGEGVYYLEYQEYLNSDSEIEEKEGDFEKTIKVEQIENAYRNSIASLSLISMSRLFNERDNTIKILKLRNESFVESVENIIGTLTPLNQKNFEDVKKIKTKNQKNPLLNEIIQNYFRRACNMYQRDPTVIETDAIVGEEDLMDAFSTENPDGTKTRSGMDLTDLSKKLRKLKDHDKDDSIFKVKHRSVVKENAVGLKKQKIIKKKQVIKRKNQEQKNGAGSLRENKIFSI